MGDDVGGGSGPHLQDCEQGIRVVELELEPPGRFAVKGMRTGVPGVTGFSMS